MKAIYFSHLPQLFEAQKATHPTTTLMGGNLFPAEVLEALLTHSTFDRIVLPEPTKVARVDMKQSPLFVRHSSRITLMSEQQLTSLRQYDRLVFMSPLLDLAWLARLRRISGCQGAPATGVIHSMNGCSMLRLFMLLAVSQLTSSDALICSSTSGRTSVANFNKLLLKRVSSCGWQMPMSEYRTPVIPLGINTADFNRSSNSVLRERLQIPSGPVVLYFGRFSSTSKGDLVPLILAFAHLLKRHPNSSLIVAGDDTQYKMAEEFRSLAEKLSPDGSIKVLPNPDREAKRELYALSDIFVSPSDSLQETFGITIVEAMAAGLLVVASDWDGYKDFIVEGETGFRITTTLPLYPSYFDELRGSGSMFDVDLLAATTIIDWNQFIDRVSLLISNEQLRSMMSKAARERAQRLYDWSAVIAEYEALWDDLASQGSHQRLNGRPTLDLDSFGYREIFSHYSTRHLTPDVKLHASTCNTTGAMNIPLLLEGNSWFQASVFRLILMIANENDGISVGAVLALLGAGDEPQEVINIAHVSRLIKYGLLEMR